MQFSSLSFSFLESPCEHFYAERYSDVAAHVLVPVLGFRPAAPNLVRPGCTRAEPIAPSIAPHMLRVTNVTDSVMTSREAGANSLPHVQGRFRLCLHLAEGRDQRAEVS